MICKFNMSKIGQTSQMSLQLSGEETTIIKGFVDWLMNGGGDDYFDWAEAVEIVKQTPDESEYLVDIQRLSSLAACFQIYATDLD